jgi:hypothetical protein
MQAADSLAALLHGWRNARCGNSQRASRNKRQVKYVASRLLFFVSSEIPEDLPAISLERIARIVEEG